MISVKNNRKDYLKKRLCMVNISNRKISEENEITDVILNFNSFFSFLRKSLCEEKGSLSKPWPISFRLST